MKKGLVAITGASGGIGRATALHFAKAGYPLLLIARRLSKLKELQLPNVHCAEVDVSDLLSFKNAIVKAEEKFGELDCLINNAGLLFVGLASEQDPEKWKKMVDVNVMGVLNGIHLVLENMKKKQTGTIFNISSLAGRKAFPSCAVYSATKFAVHALTESIREEMADHNVRLVTIAPGNVKTNIWDHAVAEELKKEYGAYKRSPYEEIDPMDVAKAILFIYEQPQNVCIREMVICPTRQVV